MRCLLLSLIISVTACATSDLSSQMASWQGVGLAEVVSVWGAPDQCSTRAANQLCVWRDRTFDGSTTCTRMLEVDENGVVIGWRWRGDRCDLVAVSTPRDAERVADSRPSG